MKLADFAARVQAEAKVFPDYDIEFYFGPSMEGEVASGYPVEERKVFCFDFEPKGTAAKR